MWNKCGTVLFAGLLSGSLLGVIEAVQLLLAVGAGEYDALFWGGIGYAIFGALVSLPLVLLFWRLTKQQRFAWTTPVVMGIMGLGVLHWQWCTQSFRGSVTGDRQCQLLGPVSTFRGYHLLLGEGYRRRLQKIHKGVLIHDTVTQ